MNMDESNPITKSKDQYTDIIDQIKSDSSVGIDAQYTHAIIIDHLQQLVKRVERLEKLIENKN